jgi:hypothetical protein
MKTKVCGSCLKEFPKTKEYFYKRTIKQQNVSGYAEYSSFKSCCKKCHSENGEKRRIKSRCKELGVKPSCYRAAWKKQYSETRTTYKNIRALPIPISKQRTIISKIIAGYNFTTLDKYMVDAKNELHISLEKKRRKKANYSDLPKGYVLWKDVPTDLRLKIKNQRITDSRLANWLGSSVFNCDPELLKTKRLLVEMNKYIKTLQSPSHERK